MNKPKIDVMVTSSSDATISVKNLIPKLENRYKDNKDIPVELIALAYKSAILSECNKAMIVNPAIPSILNAIPDSIYYMAVDKQCSNYLYDLDNRSTIIANYIVGCLSMYSSKIECTFENMKSIIERAIG